ncbi:Open rectifier potassium channel protein 1 [Papilio machaon]|uniref:Open rectifier potassium channel protein 1 n=1 Tax=Papilio machaon TaxID=76193 RepID=A0A194QST4_PAPMA|nr:Open rectifier potassium channel protein 1 [Papilio machaon]
MMSKKQLACMLALHIVYLLVGASIFYHIESPVELAQRAEEKLERLEIQNLLYENYIPNDPEKQDSILRKLSDYCGKSMFNYTTEDEEPPFKWDFYHSFFFSYTVVSTIGYGNLSPTTHLSRILMIFYGLFGIPINGILLANLGEYFGLQLISTYRKYKKRNEKRADNLDYFFNNLGMLGQIMLYLIPGFLFFIFLPACIFVVFEGWDYVAAVYYAFVTLTTIGFGDLVAGTVNNGFKYGYYFTYQIFLIIWITFGLGYIVMLLGFITSGMRSERIHKLEQKLAYQLKSTQSKIFQGFTKDMANIRKIINEANLLKLKPVYVEAAPQLHRSASCPILTFDVEPRGPIVKRKRANSENIALSARDMLRIQSDTDLLGIDKEKTFTASAIVKPAELLARVVNVLGGFETQQERGVHMFDDDHILATETPPIFSIGHEILSSSPKRTRALSVAVPNYRKESVSKLDHDFTWTNGDTAEKYRKEANMRSGKLSLPTNIDSTTTDKVQPSKSLFSRLFRKPSAHESPTEYIKNSMKGRVSLAQGSSDNVQEKTRRGSMFPSFGFGESSPEQKSDENSYKDKTRRGRYSIFQMFDFNKDEDDEAKAYKEKTKRGRHSIFPTFDFSEDEDMAAAKAYQHKPKRHSIFPTFNFSEDENTSSLNDYKEKTNSGRRSIFPTFDFSNLDEDAKRYKEGTKRGRHSIFPTFDFSNPTSNDEDDTVDEEEVQKYQNRTRKGRLSLFPTFGKSKKDDDDTLPESSDELVNYKEKTRRGRSSLFPTFGKDRKTSSPCGSTSDLETSIRQYQDQTKKGRNSLFAGDIQNYRNATEGGRRSLFSGDIDEYRNMTRRGRPSLFDPDVDLSTLSESAQVEVLEQTSVADLLRALAALETASQVANNTIGTDGVSDNGQNRRRGSLRPDFSLPPLPSRFETEDVTGPRRRRVSARAAAPQFTPTLATVVAGAELQITAKAARENRMSMLNQPPPPYTESTQEEPQQPRTRRYSPAPTDLSRSSGPVPRLFSRIRKESTSSPESSSRRGSLTDIVIDSGSSSTSKDKT